MNDLNLTLAGSLIIISTIIRIKPAHLHISSIHIQNISHIDTRIGLNKLCKHGRSSTSEIVSALN